MGNQLFQYAFGRALALRSEASLELDAITLFEKDVVYRRSYAINDFKLPDSVMIQHKKQPWSYFRGRVSEWLDRGKPLAKKSFVREYRKRQFYPEYHNWRVRRPVTLLGYWQSPRYFAEIEHELRQELQFREPICLGRQSLADEITSENSVAVHVRQSQFGRTLSANYYREAMKQIRASVFNPRFYVFSDFPGWWETHCDNGVDVCLVNGIDLPAIEDFKLMTHCKHFIIANSSYSWWAAWLGRSLHKQVIAPSRVMWDNQDILCESWIPVDIDVIPPKN